MSTTIQRTLFRNGRLREEPPTWKGRRHGVVRAWRENGVPAAGEPYPNGILHGVCRQWTETGKLLDIARASRS